MRSILNSFDMNTKNARSIGNSELLEVDKPLNLVNDDTLNLGGLSSYGTAGQIIKVNADGDGLEYGVQTDTQYSAGTNVTITDNVIASDQKTTLTFNAGQKLRGTGNSTNVRDIAYVDTNNDIIFGDSRNNVGFTVSTGIYFLGDSTPLISNTRAFNSSTLTNTGNINNLSGNINLSNENKINFNNDVNNSIGSTNALAGVELKGFNNVLITTSVANTPSINVGQANILCKGVIAGKFITGSVERELLQLLVDNSIQLGDAGCELSVKGTKTTFESGNPLEIYSTIKFLNAVTSSYIVGSTGNSLLGINTNGDLVNIFGNGVDNTTLKGNNIDFEGFSSFNGDIQMVREKKLYFDVGGLLSNSNWIKSTTDDGQDGLNIQGSTGIKLTTQGFSGEIFLNQGTVEISANLTTFDNDIIATNSDLALNGDFTGSNCDISIDGQITVAGDFTGSNCDINIDGQIKVALLQMINLDRNNTGTIFNFMRANPSVQLNNSPGVSSGQAGGTEIKGYEAVLLSQTNNPSVNNAELWVSANRVNVSATTFNYPTGGGSGSDDRIKFNEIPVHFDCLKMISSLQVEVYDKHFIKDRDRFMDREIGIIAQDTYNKIKNQVDSATADLFVSEIDYTIPNNFTENGDIVEDQVKRVIHNDMVTGNTTETIEENILAVSYIRFISVLIKSQQQQQVLIQNQQAQIDELIRLVKTG